MIEKQELLELDCEPLLYRLFNEEKVRLFDAEPVEFQCSCSRPKIERTLPLRAMGRVELEGILQEQNTIQVDCEFCSKQYLFDRVDVETLLSQESIANQSQTRH